MPGLFATMHAEERQRFARHQRELIRGADRDARRAIEWHNRICPEEKHLLDAEINAMSALSDLLNASHDKITTLTADNAAKQKQIDDLTAQLDAAKKATADEQAKLDAAKADPLSLDADAEAAAAKLAADVAAAPPANTGTTAPKTDPPKAPTPTDPTQVVNGVRVLTTTQRPLYVFDGDKDANATGAAGKWTLATDPDGSELAVGGTQPMYLFADDTDSTPKGDGVVNAAGVAYHVAKG